MARSHTRPAFWFQAPAAGLSGRSAAPSLRQVLPPGQALTLQARRAGELRILQGCVWVTFGPSRPGSRQPAGDHFYRAGDSLALHAGDTLVMESWCPGQPAPACFGWQGADAARAAWTVLLAGLRNARQPSGPAPGRHPPPPARASGAAAPAPRHPRPA